MAFVYVPYDPNHYATNLHLNPNGMSLNWDNSAGTEVLIVQTPFGQNAIQRIEFEIIPALNKTQPKEDAFVEVLPGTLARMVSAADKARMGGCPHNGEASTYTVFATCGLGDGTVQVFEQRDQAMISPVCDLPLRLGVTVSQHMTRVGFGPFARTTPTGFYSIVFDRRLGAAYRDGDVCYRIGDFEVPLTGKAIDACKFYVKSAQQPSVFARNQGIRIV